MCSLFRLSARVGFTGWNSAGIPFPDYALHDFPVSASRVEVRTSDFRVCICRLNIPLQCFGRSGDHVDRSSCSGMDQQTHPRLSAREDAAGTCIGFTSLPWNCSHRHVHRQMPVSSQSLRVRCADLFACLVLCEAHISSMSHSDERYPHD